MSRVAAPPESPAGSDDYYSETEESDVEEQSVDQSANQSDPGHSPVTGDLDDSESDVEESNQATNPTNPANNQNYSQYMAKNRSRYTYSPDPSSPVKKSNKQPINHSNHSTPTRLKPPSAIETNNRSSTQSNSRSADHSDEEHEENSDDQEDDQSEDQSESPSKQSANNQSTSHSDLSAELTKARALIAERENDIKLAAQIGETLMEENERLEDMIIQLQADLIKRENSEDQLVEQLNDHKKICDELRAQLEEQSSSQASKVLMSPTSTSAVHDFLRQELSATASSNQSIHQSIKQNTDQQDEYTGDLTSDIRAFSRRLNNERRSINQSVKQLQEQIARLEDELSNKRSEINQSINQVSVERARADQLNDQLQSIRQKHRLAEQELLNNHSRQLIAIKQSNERSIADLEHQLREERTEKALNQSINQSITQKHEELVKSSNKQIEQLNQQIEQLNQQIDRLNNQLSNQSSQLLEVQNERDLLLKKVDELVNQPSNQTIIQSINPSTPATKKKTKKKRETSTPIKQSITELTDGESNQAVSPSITEDDEQSQLLKQLHSNITDARQQLTQFRVDEEKKLHDDQTIDQSITRPVSQLTEREQLKAKAKEKRAKAAAAKAAMEQATLEAQMRADQIERERHEQTLAQSLSQSSYQSTNQSTNQSPGETNNDSLNRSDSNVSSMMGDPSELSLSASPSISQSIDQLIPSTPSTNRSINPALLIPGSSTFAATPSFDRPALEWSALDHFTLTHIHLLLSQMWSIALSLLTCSPDAPVQWIDDKLPACLLCHSKFTFRNRRHHCRLCGGLFCASCSNHKIDVDKFGYKSARACNTCFVVASTVVLCRKAVETGQVEYGEIVKEAEKYAAQERTKAEQANQSDAQSASQPIKKPKQLRALESANGSMSYQLVSPRSESGSPTPNNQSNNQSRSHTPITPALVPFYEGGKPVSSGANTPDRKSRH